MAARRDGERSPTSPLRPIPRGILPCLAGVAVLIAAGCGVGSGKYAADPTAPMGGGATEVANIESPMVISHRGGASVYPEQSMEGFVASAEDGFYPEMDVRFLKDGTPVLAHDDTVERTMTGVRGNVVELTPEEWRGSQIVSPNGGDPAPAVFLDDLLDELGGDIVLVPEIKNGASMAEADRVLDSLADHGLQDQVIVQSFDYSVSKRVVEAGMASLFLTGEDAAATPERMRADGIEWLGPSAKMPVEEMNAFAEAGIRVAPYTLPTRTEGEALGAEVSGFFTDEPWS